VGGNREREGINNDVEVGPSDILHKTFGERRRQNGSRASGWEFISRRKKTSGSVYGKGSDWEDSSESLAATSIMKYWVE